MSLNSTELDIPPSCNLFLIEFIHDDKFKNFRAEFYPFYSGAARKIGIDCQWVQLLVSNEDCSPDNKFIIMLNSEKRSVLLKTLKEFKPSFMITNEKLSDKLTLKLKTAYPDLSILSLADGTDIHYLMKFLDFLRIKHSSFPDECLLDFAEPVYDPEILIKPSYGSPPVKILSGHECLYRNAISKNSMFQGIDLSGIEIKAGCSFCSAVLESFPDCRTSYIDLAMMQISAVMDFSSRLGQKKEFFITGQPVFYRLETLLKTLLKKNYPPSDFYFTCRIDGLLKKYPWIRRLLPQLQAAGHTFNLTNIGIENFSSAENKRFNKGLINEQIVKANQIILQLETEFPNTFFFRKHGGFAMIIFTPWTTLDDLKINIHLAKKMKISGSLFFKSRLQLIPGRPITFLAERDGLIVRDFYEVPYDSGCIVEWNKNELPWRFLHQEAATVYRISIRLIKDGGVSADDPDFPVIQSFLELFHSGRNDQFGQLENSHLLILLDMIIDVLRDNPAEKSIPVILKKSLSQIIRTNIQLFRTSSIPILLLVSDMMRYLAEHPKKPLFNYTLEYCDEFPRKDKLTCTLSNGLEKLNLIFQPLKLTSNYYASAGRIAINYDSETPLNTSDKHEIIRRISLFLKSRLPEVKGSKD
jgi:hypothetical protein